MTRISTTELRIVAKKPRLFLLTGVPPGLVYLALYFGLDRLWGPAPLFFFMVFPAFVVASATLTSILKAPSVEIDDTHLVGPRRSLRGVERMLLTNVNLGSSTPPRRFRMSLIRSTEGHTIILRPEAFSLPERQRVFDELHSRIPLAAQAKDASSR
jgi:hypothetical protein